MVVATASGVKAMTTLWPLEEQPPTSTILDMVARFQTQIGPFTAAHVEVFLERVEFYRQVLHPQGFNLDCLIVKLGMETLELVLEGQELKIHKPQRLVEGFSVMVLADPGTWAYNRLTEAGGVACPIPKSQRNVVSSYVDISHIYVEAHSGKNF